VTYLPSNPKIHRLGSAEERLLSQNLTCNVLALILALLFAFLLAYVEIRARRELRLARGGEVTEGRIIEKTNNEFMGRRSYRVRYRLDTPDGVRRIGSVTTGRMLWEWLRIGSVITVLYDPDNPRNHCPTFGLRFVQFLTDVEEE
jgi:hypothetical protein